MGWILTVIGALLLGITVLRKPKKTKREVPEALPDLTLNEREITVYKVYRYRQQGPETDTTDQKEASQDTFAPDAGGTTEEPPQHPPRETIREEWNWQSENFSSPVLMACFEGEAAGDLDIEDTEKMILLTDPAQYGQIVSEVLNKYMDQEDESTLLDTEEEPF